MHLRYYKFLLSIRPTQLGSVAKAVLRVKRRVIKVSAGTSYWADPVSVFGFALLSQGCYEPALTRVVQRLLRPGDVFVDVGANEGYFSVLAARSVQNGIVISVEPQTRLIPMIQRNVIMNDVRAVCVGNFALSDRNGQAQLYLRPSSNTGASSFYKHWKLGSRWQLVPTKRLDDVLREREVRHVRLIKIDCEGAEGLVLAGAIDVLRRQMVDFWVMDYHPHISGLENCQRAHALLSDAGYRLAKHEGLCIYFAAAQETDLLGLGVSARTESWRD